MKCLNSVIPVCAVLSSCFAVESAKDSMGIITTRLRRSETIDSSLSNTKTASTASASRYLQNSTPSDIKLKDEEQKLRDLTRNETANADNEDSSKTIDQPTIHPESKVMNDDDDDESSSFSVPFLLLALAGIGYLIRKRLMSNSMNSGRWIAGAMPLPTEDFDEDEMIHYRKQEMVTISNEDEWGWEDNANRDIENGLSGGHHNDKANIQNELNFSADMNLKGSAKTFVSSRGLKRPSSSYIRGTSSSSVGSVTPRADNSTFTESSKTTKPVSNITASETKYTERDDDENDDNWDEDDDNWDDHPAPTQKVHAPVSAPVHSPSSTTTGIESMESSKSASLNTLSSADPSIEDLLKEQQLSGNIPVITSLKKSLPESKPLPKTAKKKPEEDDIFASMGLSTLPKTSAKKTPPVQKSTKVAPSVRLPSSSLSAAELISPESEDAGSDWGDDSDLNDLLDD